MKKNQKQKQEQKKNILKPKTSKNWNNYSENCSLFKSVLKKQTKRLKNISHKYFWFFKNASQI